MDFSDVLEDFEVDTFNTNASVLENILYGLPTKSEARDSDYLLNKNVRAVLDESGATPELKALGWDIAREFSNWSRRWMATVRY